MLCCAVLCSAIFGNSNLIAVDFHFSEVYEANDALFESLVALEEFCKELAAIAFVKYHHATE